MNITKLIKSKTLTLTGQETQITCTGAGTAIRNDGTDTIYVSGEAGIVKGSDGVVSIPAGGSVVLPTGSGKLYLTGNGTIMLMEARSGENPFKTSAQSGGSGADDVARAAIASHSGNAVIHVTAAEKEVWNSKADKSDIPDKLPANGGNADTLGGRAPSDYANSCNASLDLYLSEKSGDIRALAHLLPPGGFSADTSWFADVTFPISGTILLTWTRNSYKTDGNVYLYGVLTVRPLASAGDTYICSVYNTELYTEWQKLSDGGNAVSLSGRPASDFVLKTEYDSLAERVAALESK